ncbi:hypothetical protein Tco_1382448 [Tanacetum coccineum]
MVVIVSPPLEKIPVPNPKINYSRHRASMTADINVFAIGQQHTEQPEFNNEGEVDQNAEQCRDTHPLPAKLIDN